MVTLALYTRKRVTIIFYKGFYYCYSAIATYRNGSDTISSIEFRKKKKKKAHQEKPKED